jgi:hypothetical protein
VLESELFVVDNSVEVVVAWAAGPKVPPAAGTRNVTVIVCVAPAARSPTVHFFVALSKLDEFEETKVRPP